MKARLTLAAALALALAPLPLRADAPAPAPADPVLDAAKAQLAAAESAILVFYPPDAKAKGIEGEATLNCRRTPHGALTGCTLAAETPAGAGFGAAALAIAQRSRDDPTVAAPQDEIDNPHPIAFSFRLSPPEIEPNVLLPQVIQPLAWLGLRPGVKPDRYYPERASRLGVGGRALLDCYIGDDGVASLCAVVGETPPGFDFGKTALGLTAMMRGRKPPPGVPHRHVFPVNFQPPAN
jgi:TonB family protein